MRYFIITSIALILMFVSVNSVFAATTIPSGNNTQCAPGKLCNPLNYSSVEQLLPKILDIVAQFGLIICTFFIILAGFKYVTANGDPGNISKAHNILLWAVVGTAVLLGAKVLASILSNTVNQIIK